MCEIYTHENSLDIKEYSYEQDATWLDIFSVVRFPTDG